MSLPQRKKTPEEIAKLREELGIPGGPTAAPPTSPSAAPEPATPEPADPTPSADSSEPAEEPVPVLEEQASPEEKVPALLEEATQPVVTHYEEPHVSGPKPVRSLRKSERIPSSRSVSTSTNSNLPTQRRTEKELSQLRRSQPITTAPVTHLIALTAHPFMVGLGYFLVFGAALMPFLGRWMEIDIPYIVLALMCAGGFFISGFIFLKKKRSLHHAGFIAMIALLVLVFAALYYFPNLRNAS